MTDPLQGLSFAALFDAAGEAMLLVDEKGVVVRANIAAQQMFDYGAQEFMGMRVESLVPLPFRAQHIGRRQAYFNEPKQRTMSSGKKLVALRRDGAELPVDISLSPIEAQGKQYVLAIFHGIERQLQAETSLKTQSAELHDARARYRVLIDEALSGMVLVFGHDGRILDANEQAVQVLGYSTGELLGMHITDIVSYTDLPRLQVDWSKIQPGQPMIFARRYCRKDGYVFPVEEHLGIQTGEGQRIYVGFARDVTERTRSEARQKEAHAELEQLTHYQVAVQTAAAIAHELNQPLAAISAYSEVALHALAKDDKNFLQLKRALEGCAVQAQRAGQSLHELIAYLQEGETTAESFDLNALVQTVLAEARTNGFNEFSTRLDLEADLPRVRANRIQVHKVLNNLVGNSVEAMRNAGMQTASVLVRISTLSDQGLAKVTIQDTGPGIDSEFVKRLFEPFFSTKPKGIGMGLVISRALIEANGGQLWFDPEDGSGATFHFTLPLD